MIDALRRRSSGWFPALFAGAAAIGCGWPNPLDPWVAGIALLVVVVMRSRPLILIITIALSGALASQALAGLRPIASGAFDGQVVLVNDPSPSFGLVKVDVRTDLGRMEMVGYGAAGRRLSSLVGGDRIVVKGRIAPLGHPDRVRHRHLRDRLTIEGFIGDVDPSLMLRPVNAVRSTIIRGASPLPAAMRPVYGGFVIGDDRGSSESVVDEFERSGLSHLLVVSGENLVFLIAIASPLLDRLGPRSRVIATLSLLLFFAALTRFEPSVLRATVMTAIATFGVALGRPVQAARRLALAVGVLLLVDPMLFHSFGFRLSVAATAGIVFISPRIVGVVPGPRWSATGVAVTVGAQLAVAPLVVPVFGPMRLVSIPANVLAEPVAGLVMMWGCTGGLVAGMFTGPIAWVLQLPTRVALWWIMGVASVGSSLPSPALGLPMMLSCVAAILVWRRLVSVRSARRSRALPG